jgi:putative oxidoreductase
MVSAAAGAVVLVGRVLFALYFGAVASVAHIRQRQSFEGYAKAMGFPLVPLAGWPAGIWLVVGALSVALGVWPDVGVLMIALFVVVAAFFFHAYWRLEDQHQKMNQSFLFWRNIITLGASVALFGLFASLGEALRFTVTAPLFQF